jgi:predicted nucleic acid-binding Zn finger protein
VATQELLIFERALDELRSNRELSRLSWQRLHSTFGDRFTKAWRLVTESRIKKYVFRPSGRIVWIAVGQTGEYMIYPHAIYCSCNDFYFRVLDGETGLCYHLMAQKIAETLDHFDTILEEDEVYDQLLEIWRKELTED